MATNVTLIICTRNRGESLVRCLDAVPPGEMRAVGGELVVVDNGSTDDTPRIAESFAKRAGFPVRVVTEPEAGLNRARNAGLEAARGGTIAYTDDDCYLEPGYLTRLGDVFAGGEFQYCGGRILIHDETDAQYGHMPIDRFMLYPPGCFLAPGRIQGANMAFDREVVTKVGGFDVRIGVGTPFRCGDIDYCARASLAGFTGAHVPDLVVRHHHGRKPGPEIRALLKENDFARGSYYAKIIDLGARRYRLRWFLSAVRPWRLPRTLRELRGARRFREFVRGG